MSTISDRLLAFVEASDERGFIRSEFNRLGSRSGVNRALRALQAQGRMIWFGTGLCRPAKNGRGRVREADAVLDALTKLGAEPEWGGWAWREYAEGRTTQVPMCPTVTVRKRMTRRIGRGNMRYRYEWAVNVKEKS